MIVDGHLHLWEAASAVSPLPYLLPTSVASINELEKEMRPAGVTHAVLVQPQVHRQDHSLLGAVLSRDLDRDRGVGLVDDNVAESDIPGEVERLAGLGMAGIRVHLIDNQGGNASKIARTAKNAGLILHLHLDQASWPKLRPILDAAGGSPVAVDHLERPDDPSSNAARNFLESLQAFENVYVRASALDLLSHEPVTHSDVTGLVADAASTLGPTRVFWGSNFPWSRGHRYGWAIPFIKSLGDQESSLILSDTALNLYFGRQTSGRI